MTDQTNVDRAAAIIARFLPPLPGNLGPLQAEKTSRALHAAGVLMPDDMSTQTETVGPFFPEGEEAPDVPDGTDVYRVVGPWVPVTNDGSAAN